MRTSKEGFEFIYHNICNHEVFQNNSTCEQLPIAHQLALTLERLGSNGNAASVGKFARNFQQRRQISQVMRQEGFDGCVGFIDGTNFPLYGKPAWQGEVYFDWKKNYLINAQILCDCDNNIIAFITGWPGLCADAMFGLIWIQNNSNFNKANCTIQTFSCRLEVSDPRRTHPSQLSSDPLVSSIRFKASPCTMENFNRCFRCKDYEVPHASEWVGPNSLRDYVHILECVEDTAKDASDRMVYMETNANNTLKQRHQNTRRYIMRLITLKLNLLNFDIRPHDGPWIMTHFCSTLMILTHHLAIMNAEIEDARDSINRCHL
ncbi:hypothetical protein O181_050103 [Austropuccinia psidii MF-1]|uniref:DDE Tnp4 domain-containing protein n=1 Tax=Austropuccinia psidii MF-1 TaxID=1389203 RepID=A0A9Q3E148_9BASI|nr:hypothetical protein [Austropuccinia psidii MF-1]